MENDATNNEAVDAQVEILRKYLDDPLRVAQVSGSTFPLQVWERMFALDREKRAVDAVKRQEDQYQQQQQLEQTNRSSGGGGVDHADNESTFSGGSRQTSPSMGSMSSFGDPLGQFGFGGASRRKPPQLRNCRDGSRLNSTFMRGLVRETLHYHHPQQNAELTSSSSSSSSSPLQLEIPKSSTPSSTQFEIVVADNKTQNVNQGGGNKNLFSFFSTLSSTINNNNDQKNQIPTAVLSCVSIPERLASPQKNSQQQQQNNNNKNNKNSPSPQRNDSPSPQSATGEVSEKRKRQQQQQDHHSVGSFRAHPIRPFAPVSSFWGNNVMNGGAVDGGGAGGGGGTNNNNAVGGGAAGNGTVIGAELLRMQVRLQAMARPAVERHDLPFEVTPANDFRQLPCPLTGLGHAVPYEDLQQEQQQLMSLCSKR